VPPGFDEWFAKVCNPERSERFQSAKEMAAAFEKLAAGLSEVPPVDESRPKPLPSGTATTEDSALGRSAVGLTQTKPEAPSARRAVGPWIGAGLVALVLIGGLLVVVQRRAAGPAVEESAAAAPEPDLSAALAAPAPAPDPAPSAAPAPAASSAAPPTVQPVVARPAPAVVAPLPAQAPPPPPAPAPKPAPAAPGERDYGF
jgi:DamX protein